MAEKRNNVKPTNDASIPTVRTLNTALSTGGFVAHVFGSESKLIHETSRAKRRRSIIFIFSLTATVPRGSCTACDATPAFIFSFPPAEISTRRGACIQKAGKRINMRLIIRGEKRGNDADDSFLGRGWTTHRPANFFLRVATRAEFKR